jgi:GT2 family glycosyltransferase
VTGSTSVVVVSYQLHGWLERCLQSVAGQADEVILVDNGSPGGAVGAVGRRCGVRVEVLPENRGFAVGVNAGVRRATGDLVALLNDDAVAEPGWLASAGKALADPDVAAVGPKILFQSSFVELRFDEEPHFAPPDGRPLGRMIERVELDGRVVPLGGVRGSGVHGLERRGQGGTATEFRWTAGSGPVYVPLGEQESVSEVRVDGEPIPVVATLDLISCAGSYLSACGFGGDYGFGAHDNGAFDEPAERFGTTGAAMVARAETFERIGGLAESYFAYYEDLDWCWRARLGGLRFVYDPSAVVRHVGGASTGGPGSDRVRFLAARNRIQTLARNAPLPVVWSELRSPVDRPDSGMGLALAERVARGLLERRRLARRWVCPPGQVWQVWAGRDERWEIR